MMMTRTMRPRPPLLTSILVAAALLVAAAWAYFLPESPLPSGPNVVVIVADDLGFMDVSANDPATFHETRNIARLAARGTRFTHGYAAAPVCSPTRASLITGKYPARLGITNVIHTMPNVAKAMRPAENRERVEPSEVTLAEAFRDAGYLTFMSGKWHLGKFDSAPSDHGFDSQLPGPSQSYFPQDSELTPEAVDPKMSLRIARDAVRFITRAGHRPFFAYLPFPAPHLPLSAPPELVKKYEAKIRDLAAPRPGTANPMYAAMIEQLDEAIGQVLDVIESSGVADRTIVVFTSDNGGLEHFATSNSPLRAGKGTLYEGGIRVPWIISAPGVSVPGSVCDTPAITADLYPTLLELAGLPSRPGQHVDGVSLVPALQGAASPERSLCWHFPHYSVGPPAGAIREGDWKLIEWFEDGRIELFNLRDDVGESVDLASQEPERARSLRSRLVAWRETVHARLPTANPLWVGNAGR